MTVAGAVDPAALGQTLMHEHIFIDLRRAQARRAGWDSPLAIEPLSLGNLWRARLGSPTADNGFLADFDEMLSEVLEFKYAGGGTIVEVSNIGLSRDPTSLLRMSRASGLNIIMGAGWYQKNFHPVDMDERTVEDLTDVIVRDVTVGVDDTGIRSGVIGEVGVEGNPLHVNEMKSVRASGRASRLTGAPISFHYGGFREEKFEVLDALEEEGIEMTSVIMGHSGSITIDLPFARRLLARGVFVEFDYLCSPGSPRGRMGPVNDFKIAQGLVALVREGYADQILLGHDVCTKIQLKKYGGVGYSYIPAHFLPAVSAMGVGEEDIRKIMVDNPAKALTFVEPRPALAHSG
ncbi:MAG: phosphotriesterase family protein [Acidimicrobiales bacterium]